MRNEMANQAEHLEQNQIINQGSFYTPEKFVRMAADWLKKRELNRSYTIVDTSCGYGAFFRLHRYFPHNRFVGNDIDTAAVGKARQTFPFVQLFNGNALHNIGRKAFGLSSGKICIVGNPPYNDVTSQIGRSVKTAKHEIDDDVRSRDLGISFLKSYAKLDADYVLILHPLSYLIKKSNFSSAKSFFAHYKLLESVVFSSHEFEDTSRAGEFPIVMALYERALGEGLTYNAVKQYHFQTMEGDRFCLADFDYVADHIQKYPHKKRYHPEILFYTLRDINALKRSRTFIAGRCANAVDIDPEKLAYYCYIDLFKRYASVPYWMGNFDVPFNAELFDRYREEILSLACSFHPEVFGRQKKPSKETEQRVKHYIQGVCNKTSANR